MRENHRIADQRTDGTKGSFDHETGSREPWRRRSSAVGICRWDRRVVYDAETSAALEVEGICPLSKGVYFAHKRAVDGLHRVRRELGFTVSCSTHEEYHATRIIRPGSTIARGYECISRLSRHR